MSQHFDVAVLTILNAEFEAVASALEIEGDSVKHLCEGIPYHTALIRNKKSQKDLSIAVFCSAFPGNTYIAALTTLIAKELMPSLIVLVGIAAGIKPGTTNKGGAQIGCVFMPKEIFDFTMSVEEKTVEGESEKTERPERTRHRIKTYDVPAAVQRQFSQPDLSLVLKIRNEILKKDNFCITDLPALPNKAPFESLAFFEKYIYTGAEFSDKMLASSNALLKNPDVLKQLQTTRGEIRIGDMESAGVAVGCRFTKTNWMVVRGVSDFGDKDKIDQFHHLASANAAAHLRVFLEYILDIGVLREATKSIADPVKDTAILINPILDAFAKTVQAVFHKSINIQIYWPAKRINQDGTTELGIRRDDRFRAERGLHTSRRPTGFHSFNERNKIIVAKVGYEVQECYKPLLESDHQMLRWVYAFPVCHAIGDSEELLAVICCSGEECFLGENENEVSPEFKMIKVIFGSLGDAIRPIFERECILETLGGFRVVHPEDQS